ncbi:hypothetical protein NEMIN01_0334 [Nematocida minor]|uniref:uncharacterized protein n=1 Tax=Nematocida minor TaxID=1912983 RepID=UPI00221E3989|nr:uncharacterized protein NEMIN01_0334 [Nematocida minor]KAI5189168.1 hypothetical protein NEMIN01_0334 [Nematocida minor]
MCNELYIVESVGCASSSLHSITTMRIVEIGNELLYSEVLVDKEGRIPIFNIIDRNSKIQKKGVIVMDRNRYQLGREYFLDRESRPTGYGLNINGSIYVLKYRMTGTEYTRAYFSETEIILKNDQPKTSPRIDTNDTSQKISIYPNRSKERIISIDVAECTKKTTEIHTKIINSPESIIYILGVHGYKIDNGIDKKVSLVLISSNITSEQVMQCIIKYNMYISTGVKEIVDVKKSTVIESNYFLQDMQIGRPILTSQSFYYDLLYHVLLEHRVLIVSQDHNVIVNYIQSILTCILPYRWKGVLMATIPEVFNSEYKKLIEATIPYLIGIRATRSEIKEMDKNIPEKTVIAYVDEDRIVVHAKTKEKKSMLNKIYKNMNNRRSIPFYQSILKQMEFRWPVLKDQMNILMEVISTEACSAREKLIRKLAGDKQASKLRDFINGYSDYSRELLEYLPRNKEFYAEFLGTTLYNEGVSNEYVREVKEDGLDTRDLVTIIWILSFVAIEGVKKSPNHQEIRFVVEAFLIKYLKQSYQAADALLINLFSVFSSLNMYDMIIYVSSVLNDKGIQLTDEMCSALVPLIPSDTVHELRKGGSYINPWNRKSAHKEVKVPVCAHRSLWHKMPFVSSSMVNTLRSYVCVEREVLEEKNSEHLLMVLNAFDKYDLPY